jgi:hypothetical protein
MDYASLLDALGKASLFDLWRLSAALRRALEDPNKNQAIRANLRVGESIRYFEAKQNREIPGSVVAIKRSRALIQNDHDKKLWDIPFYMINLQGAHVDFHASRAKVSPDSLRVGDAVGYRSRTQREVYGVVIKLNRKTATVRLATGQQWGVPYRLLFYILDAQEGIIAEALNHQFTSAAAGAEERPDVEATDCPPE